MGKADLRIDWATHAAAKHAVEKWHYSQRLPMPPLVKVGAWEDGKFIGCILFGRGANNAIGREYGLTQLEACELVRIALTDHKAPVSRIASFAIKFLQKQSPGVRLVVSYADAEQGHHGGVYQAMNWLYVGRSMGSAEFFHEGRWKHNREITSGAFGSSRAVSDISKLPKRKTQGKHKYLMPLDDEMRAQIAPLAKPYPKRVKQATTGDQSAGRQGSTDPHAPNIAAE